MLLPANKRVSENAAIISLRNGVFTGYLSASPGGPAGSATMTFGCVFMWKANSPVTGTGYLFSRSNGAVTGWGVRVVNQTGAITSFVGNSGAATVVAPSATLISGQPVIYIARYLNGALRAWVNGLDLGTTTLGTGITTDAVATNIGMLDTGGGGVQFNTNCCRISECFMLDGFDIATTVATVYAQWAEDLQQGRYLTWPRAMTASDWYWSARDAIAGPSTKPTWTDRGGNAVALTKTGSPQACSISTRYAA